MSKAKGSPKTGGRKKGVANKSSQDLFAICEAKGINVFEGILELCKSENESIRLKALSDACRYLYPQRKAVEMSSDDAGGFKVVICDYMSS